MIWAYDHDLDGFRKMAYIFKIARDIEALSLK